MELKRDSYDVVVVGAGMGGLTAAALLAKSGLQVLLVDKNDRAGGYAQSMERGGFTFDLAVHLISGCNEGGTVRSVLDDLDVLDEAEFIKPATFYRCIFPDFTIDVPIGLKQFADVHAREFPRERQGIEALVNEMEAICHEAAGIRSSMGLSDLIRAPFAYPHLFKYRNKTFAQMLDQFIKSEKLKAALSALCIYIGLPSSRLPAIVMSFALVAIVEDDHYYIRGGSQRLVNAVVHGLEKHGGEFLPKSPVNRIHCEQGKVSSVELEGGTRVKARAVVSNVSARQTFGKLLNPSCTGKKYLDRVYRMRPTHSVFEVFMGVDIDMRNSVMAHETFVLRSYDLSYGVSDNFSQALVKGSSRAGFGMCVPTLTDSSIAPSGCHVLCMATYAPYDIGKNWDGEKEKVGESLIKQAEVYVPGLSDHILIKELVSPLDLERMTLNDEGAIYGWEKGFGQIGRKAFTFSTPVKGLYLAGHWAGEEHGVTGTMRSGKRVSDAIIKTIH